MAQHIRDAKAVIRGTCKRKINKRYSWIISLLNKNELPGIYLLENCSLENWKQREVYWISQFDNLTNMTKGGDGGDTNSGRKFGPLSEERKAAISKATKEGMKSEEVRAKCRLGNAMIQDKVFMPDGSLRPDIKPKISAGLKKYHSNKNG